MWHDFEEFEKGAQENALTAQVVGLLQTQPQVDLDLAIQNILWKEVRRYRVSITVGDSHSDEAGRLRLFKGYDTAVAGAVRKRKGETFYVKTLRKWMADLAIKAISAVHSKVTSDV